MKNRKTRKTNNRKNKKQSSFRSRRKTTGLGIRNVSAPMAQGVVLKNRSSLSTLRFSHSEFVSDLQSVEAGDTRVTFKVNPGMMTCFPWLSQLAGAFESYKIHNLSFSYVTAVGTDTAGQVALCPDYDATDNNALLHKSALMMFQDTVRTPIWQGATMVCTPANLQRRKSYFTRSGSVTLSSLALHDVMKLEILITSPAFVGVIGELWVHYDVTLMTPQHEPVSYAELDGETLHAPTAAGPFADTTKTSGLMDTLTDVAATIKVVGTNLFSIARDARYLIAASSYKNGGTFSGVNLITCEEGINGSYARGTIIDHSYGFSDDRTIVYCLVDVTNATEIAPLHLEWNGSGGAIADWNHLVVISVDPLVIESVPIHINPIGEVDQGNEA
jgi:hypothetical protein